MITAGATAAATQRSIPPRFATLASASLAMARMLATRLNGRIGRRTPQKPKHDEAHEQVGNTHHYLPPGVVQFDKVASGQEPHRCQEEDDSKQPGCEIQSVAHRIQDANDDPHPMMRPGDR